MVLWFINEIRDKQQIFIAACVLYFPLDTENMELDVDFCWMVKDIMWQLLSMTVVICFLWIFCYCECLDLQICDELNFPTLRRVRDWKENEREWKYALPQVSSADYKVRCYYQYAGYIKSDRYGIDMCCT
jgi:hypothetical protein